MKKSKEKEMLIKAQSLLCDIKTKQLDNADYKKWDEATILIRRVLCGHTQREARKEYFEITHDGEVLGRYLTSNSDRCFNIYCIVSNRFENAHLDFNVLEMLFLNECKKQKIEIDVFNNCARYTTTTYYRATLTINEISAWEVLNSIFAYVNNDCENYKAIAKSYVNVGNSMIRQLDIVYFKREQEAHDFIYSLLERFNYKGVAITLDLSKEVL